MPNWCENKLTITGPADEVKKFREIAEPLSMARLLPIPEELKCIHYVGGPSGAKHFTTEEGFPAVDYSGVVDLWERKRYRTVGDKNIPLSDEEQEELFKKYGARDWYEWTVKHWGTKWDLYPDDLKDKEITGAEVAGGVEYRFDTAWGPPIPFFLYLSQTFPSLAFHVYFIDFPNFEGESWLKEGQVVRDECWGPFDIQEECERQSSNKGGA